MGGATPAQIRCLAMGYLARREHGYGELIVKLRQRGVTEQDARATVAKLAEEGLQDDTRFADMYLRAQTSRGKGPLYISNGLRQRGMSSADADNALQRANHDWAASACEVAARKYNACARANVADKHTERARRMRFLLQRGFTPEQSAAALKQLEP